MKIKLNLSFRKKKKMKKIYPLEIQNIYEYRKKKDEKFSHLKDINDESFDYNNPLFSVTTGDNDESFDYNNHLYNNKIKIIIVVFTIFINYIICKLSTY